jgi:hypothetical protein
MNNKNIMSVVITIAVLAVIGWILITRDQSKVGVPIIDTQEKTVVELPEGVAPLSETVRQ